MNDSGGTSLNPIEGQVADGYLRGAIVCLDVDGDKKCSDDEPTAISQEQGTYAISVEELEKLAGEDPADFPIVVEVPATAIDEDKLDLGLADATVGQPYVLMAPAGKHQFVSPMTTMVQG